MPGMQTLNERVRLAKILISHNDWQSISANCEVYDGSDCEVVIRGPFGEPVTDPDQVAVQDYVNSLTLEEVQAHDLSYPDWLKFRTLIEDSTFFANVVAQSMVDLKIVLPLVMVVITATSTYKYTSLKKHWANLKLLYALTPEEGAEIKQILQDCHFYPSDFGF